MRMEKAAILSVNWETQDVQVSFHNGPDALDSARKALSRIGPEYAGYEHFVHGNLAANAVARDKVMEELGYKHLVGRA